MIPPRLHIDTTYTGSVNASR